MQHSEKELTSARLRELIRRVKSGEIENPNRIKSAVGIARAINMSQSGFSNIIHGNNKLSAENASKIAELFPGITAAWLLGIDDKTVKEAENRKDQ